MQLADKFALGPVLIVAAVAVVLCLTVAAISHPRAFMRMMGGVLTAAVVGGALVAAFYFKRSDYRNRSVSSAAKSQKDLQIDLSGRESFPADRGISINTQQTNSAKSPSPEQGTSQEKAIAPDSAQSTATESAKADGAGPVVTSTKEVNQDENSKPVEVPPESNSTEVPAPATTRATSSTPANSPATSEPLDNTSKLESEKSQAQPESAATSPAAVTSEEKKPDPRPEWVESESRFENGTYRTAIVTQPNFSIGDCENELPSKTWEAVWRFFSNVAPHRYSRLLRTSDNSISLVKDTWVEKIETSVQPMYRLHALVVIDPETIREWNAYLDQRGHEVRINIVAIGFGTFFLLVGLIFAYLKIDTATRGYYTRRLQLGCFLGILGVCALCLQLLEGFAVLR